LGTEIESTITDLYSADEVFMVARNVGKFKQKPEGMNQRILPLSVDFALKYGEKKTLRTDDKSFTQMIWASFSIQ
jgi:hypothetical protein